MPHLSNRSPCPPQLWRASWGQSLLRKHDTCANHEGTSAFCSPSIFKLIIWKQAAVNFGHRRSDETLRPLLPFGFFCTTPVTLRVTLDTKSQPCWPVFPTQQSFCCDGMLAHFRPPLRNAALPLHPKPPLHETYFPGGKKKKKKSKTPPPFGAVTRVFQTLHRSIVPYVCAAPGKISLESADANYKFNLHFN